MSDVSSSSDDDFSSDVPLPPASPPTTPVSKTKKSKRKAPTTPTKLRKQNKKNKTKKITTQRGKGFNSWREAVKMLNKDSSDFSIPRKGSKRYEEAKKLSIKLKKQYMSKSEKEKKPSATESSDE